jgi:hypothetical protein
VQLGAKEGRGLSNGAAVGVAFAKMRICAGSAVGVGAISTAAAVAVGAASARGAVACPQPARSISIKMAEIFFIWVSYQLSATNSTENPNVNSYISLHNHNFMHNKKRPVSEALIG